MQVAGGMSGCWSGMCGLSWDSEPCASSGVWCSAAGEAGSLYAMVLCPSVYKRARKEARREIRLELLKSRRETLTTSSPMQV